MSTPRETIAAFLHEMQHGEPRTYLTPDENAEELLRLLKANGLFVGPIVATPEMAERGNALVGAWGDDEDAVDTWNKMVETWERGESS